MMHFEQVFESIVDEVMEYESDTFSSVGSEITRAEARQVVCQIIKSLWDERIDGVLIDFTLDKIRTQ